MPRLARLLAASLVAALPAACAHHPAHPVIGGPWGGGAPAGVAVGTAGDPSAGEVAPPAARRAFFGDMGRLDERLAQVRALFAPEAVEPLRRSLPEAARSLLRRLASRGPLGGRVRNVLVYGTVGRLPLTPRDAAGLWLDPAVQGAALGTPAFHRDGVVYGVPEAFRQAARVAIEDVGTKPLTFDLVFGTFVEVRELGDTSVLLRYDPRPVPGAKHVTLWRGGCVFEPDGAGCIATEVVIFGTDVWLPLLEGALRAQVEQAFANRSERLWKIAHAAAAKIPRSAPR